MTKDYWLALAFALCAYMVRIQGLLLIVSIVVYLCLRKAWKPAVIVSFVSLPFVVAFGTGGKYMQEFWLKEPSSLAAGNAAPHANLVDLIARFTENFHQYAFGVLPTTLLPWTAWQGLSAIAGVGILFLIYRGIRK